MRRSSDRIHIEDLEVFAKHGVYAEENALGQKFLVCCDLYLSTRKAGLEDDLDASVSYGTVCHRIDRFLREHTWKLIETVAEQTAKMLLLEMPGVERVAVEIKKPWAPVGLPLKSASVRIERGWHRAFVALGSNMGDKEAYLDGAVHHLGQKEEIRIEKVSDWITTAPYGGVKQDDFLNGVMQLKTLLSPEELLGLLQQEEAAAHRERKVHWGPRTLDLDILFYDDEVIDEEGLHIPHEDLQNRDFVLRPMCQLAPWLRHPLLHRTMRELLRDLETAESGGAER